MAGEKYAPFRAYLKQVRTMFHFRIDGNTELRLLEERHVPELFRLVDQNRAYLREWLPWLDDNTSPADTKKFVRHSLDKFAANNGFQVGIWFRGKLVGVIGYHGVDWVNRSTSIGYWLAAAYQGQGLVTRACQALVDYAFTEWSLNRVEIRCAVGNRKSRAIPGRLGFKEEGIIRQPEWLYDHFVDHVVYGMLASEWPRPVVG